MLKDVFSEFYDLVECRNEFTLNFISLPSDVTLVSDTIISTDAIYGDEFHFVISTVSLCITLRYGSLTFGLL